MDGADFYTKDEMAANQTFKKKKRKKVRKSKKPSKSITADDLEALAPSGTYTAQLLNLRRGLYALTLG